MSIFEDERVASKEETAEHFGPGSSSRKAAELMKRDPDLYRALKLQAVKDGLVDIASSTIRPTPVQRQFSADEQAAMQQVSREQCVRAFKTKHGMPGSVNLGKLKQEQPEEYALLQKAARAYGVLPPTVEFRDNSHYGQLKAKQERQAATQPAKDDGQHRFRLSDAIADQIGIEHGRMVSMDEFSKCVIQASSNQRTKDALTKEAARDAEAAANKAAADKVAVEGDLSQKEAA